MLSMLTLAFTAERFIQNHNPPLQINAFHSIIFCQKEFCFPVNLMLVVFSFLLWAALINANSGGNAANKDLIGFRPSRLIVSGMC